jgi:hypothetical protein
LIQRETRSSYGSRLKADEQAEKWITDAAENEFYKTTAESDGFEFLSTIRRNAMATHSAGGKSPDVHPVLETLADDVQPGDAVRLQGYVGPTKNDRTLRLYASFDDLSEYHGGASRKGAQGASGAEGPRGGRGSGLDAGHDGSVRRSCAPRGSVFGP